MLRLLWEWIVIINQGEWARYRTRESSSGVCLFSWYVSFWICRSATRARFCPFLLSVQITVLVLIYARSNSTRRQTINEFGRWYRERNRMRKTGGWGHILTSPKRSAPSSFEAMRSLGSTSNRGYTKESMEPCRLDQESSFLGLTDEGRWYHIISSLHIWFTSSRK